MLDVSGSTGWTYDQRGRMTGETKVVSGTGGGTFFTRWGGYNAADQAGWMKYPGGNAGQTGEQVNFTYKRQLVLNTVIGTNTYVQSTSYDAAGRVDVRTLGNNTLQTNYDYFAWTAQGGRLKLIKSGLPATPESLQKLEYAYDLAGNIDWIKDWKAGNPQKQEFGTYDGLNRLTSAYADGGTGGQGDYASSTSPETYTYNAATGNLETKAGGNYTYYTGSPSKPHAVKRVTGSGSSIKSVQIRAYSTPCNDSVRATMELWVNGVKINTWTNVAASWTTYSQNVTLTGKDVIEVVFTNDCSASGYDRNLYVDYVSVDGQTVQAEGGAAVIDRGAGNSAFDGLDTIAGQEGLYWNAALRLVKGVGAYAAGYDQNGNMTSRVVDGVGQILSYDAENRLIQVQTSITTSTFAYDGEGNRVKGTIGGVTTTFIGNYFEWTSSTSTMVKYYYAGSQRVAMMAGSTVYYLLSDHLGSTALIVTSAGAIYAEKRYKPWGEERYTSGTTPTTFRFTGQRLESFGLYYYGARWYDASLGRFLSADRLITNPFNSIDWDRYSYTKNNPLRYTDPTGYKACEGADDSDCESDKSVLKDWELIVLAAIIFSESSNGSYPRGMNMIGWTYLNRVIYGTFSSITRSTWPGQSALISHLKKDFPWLANLPKLSVSELKKNFMLMNQAMMGGGNKNGWQNALRTAQSVVANYDVYGKIADPTGGATDFKAVSPEDFSHYVDVYESRKNDPKRWPAFDYKYLGPFWGGPILQKSIYLFFCFTSYSTILNPDLIH